MLTALQSLSADEQRLFRLYGKLPNKKDLLQNKLKVRVHTQGFLPSFLLNHLLPLAIESFLAYRSPLTIIV